PPPPHQPSFPTRRSSDLSADQWEASRSTAAKLGLQLSGIELREPPYDYEAALDQAPLDHRGMLIVPTSPSFFRDRARLADFALRSEEHTSELQSRFDLVC